MLKRLMFALFIVSMVCGASFATTVIDYPYDRYSLYGDLGTDTYGAYMYYLYGDETGFCYQLRDVAGNDTAGSQWFATVYENFYYNLYSAQADNDNRGVYRRTMGGEDSVSISAVGNLIGGFNFVTLEEPQPYAGWANVYDKYPDPMESLCLVIKNGRGDFTIKFGNPYASHYPFWWHWTTNPNTAWWTDRSRVSMSAINEPIAYIADTTAGTVLKREDNGSYTNAYTFKLSQDVNASGDLVGSQYYVVRNMSGTLLYRTSKDHTIICSADKTPLYTISTNNYTGIYDLSGDLKYTIEDSASDNVKYICEVRAVSESIRFSGFDDDYTFTMNPNTEGRVKPAEYYTANVRINSPYGDEPGSRLGYITFRQRADLMRGYTRYREYTTIPAVIANVVDGNAADEPLQFDMTVYDSENERTADHVVSRVKFTWDAQDDMNDLDLGTFYMMQSKDSEMPTYYLETSITNRTGTRYELYRYDMIGRTTGFKEILPQYWKYDLLVNPGDPSRDTLPDHFHLDAHSQIAPGLVTVYNSEVYGTVDTAYDTYESFQVSEYNSPNPKNLRLNYTRVRGMYPAESARRKIRDGSAEIQGFRMEFTDVAEDSDNTANEIRTLTGKTPAMISEAGSMASPDRVYIRSEAWNSFRVSKDVDTAELPGITAVYVPPIRLSMFRGAASSDDVPSTPEPEPEPESIDLGGYYSPDIAPLLPVSVRLIIPGQNRLARDYWEELNNATTSAKMFETFRKFGTVWVRSSATRERDVDLFKAIDQQNNGISASNCVHAFLYENSLYLDFMTVIADASSTNSAGGKTAFMKIFWDDKRPYILLGDGNVDGKWDLTFYVAAPGDQDYTSDGTNTQQNQNTNTQSNTQQNQTQQNTSGNTSSGLSGGSGGGCDSGLTFAGMILLAGIMRVFTKR